MGRPEHLIDWDQVHELCQIQCTQEEIAAVIGCCLDTLQARCKKEKDITFSEFYQQKRLGGRSSLRRRQWLTAYSGNPSMQIWLGKQYLDQTDKQEVKEKDPKPVHIEIVYPS